MSPAQKTSLFVSIFVSILLILDGALVLYACLIWPKEKAEHGDPLFITGIVTFVVCFTLPFLLIAAFLVIKVKIITINKRGNSLETSVAMQN